MSNLLQKASIITTPTAYDTGKILSVKPVQTYGPELVTNGDFSNGTNNWNATNSTLNLENGYLKITSIGGNRPQANQNVSGLTVGKKYRLSAEAKKGTCNLAVEIEINGIGSTVNTNKNNTTEFKNIFYEFIATSTTHTIQAKIDDGSSTVGETAFFKIVSLKEVFNADFDFSRNSSATRVGSNGLIQDVASNLPRIDYTGGVGSWKFEPQSTNLITYSEDFSQWSGGNVSIESGYLSPDGTNNATKVTATTPISKNGYLVLSGLSSPTTTRTIYARTTSGIGNIQLLSHNTNTNNVFTVTEQWQRFEVNSTLQITTNFYAVDFRSNLTTLDEVIIWAAQEEQNSFSTSYIRSNTGSATTRLADVANNAGSSDLISSTEGVLYAEISALADDVENKFMSISNGSNTEVLRIAYISGTDIRFETAMTSGTNFQKDVEINLSDNNKVCFQYKSNEYKVFVNGFSYSVTQRSTTPTGLNELSFDRGDGLRNFYGNTKSVAVFKEALTDLELECLVSWMSFSDLGINFGYTVE